MCYNILLPVQKWKPVVRCLWVSGLVGLNRKIQNYNKYIINDIYWQFIYCFHYLVLIESVVLVTPSCIYISAI